VLLVDDLVTTGQSLLDSTDKLRAEGAVVKDALVLIDREEGGIRNLAKKDVTVHALLKISEAAQILFDMGRIDQRERDSILKQTRT
jgi:orotate phosphoribosyltransferase